MARSAGSLDANVLLRLLLNDQPAQHRAAAQLVTAASGQFALADIAIIEIVFVLQRAYGFTRQQVADTIEGLMKLEKINCNRELFMRALPLYVKYPALSFEDCCLASYASLDDAEPLWTFDKKLAKQMPAAQLLS